MSKLKPCPFCGEKATLDYSVMPNRKHWFITCDCCGMMYQYTLSQRKYVKDGNAWCFVLPDFQDLQVSSSVWMKEGVLDKIYKELRSVKNERQSASND